MSAAAEPQPTNGAEVALPAYGVVPKQTPKRPSAAARLERLLGREFAEVLVRGLARRLR